MSYLEALAYARQLDDPQQGLFARTAAEKWACLLVYLETKALAAPPAAVPDDCDVRRIMIDVVPGFDGMGEEVFAKSNADVVAELTRLHEEIENAVGTMGTRPAAPLSEPGSAARADAVFRGIGRGFHPPTHSPSPQPTDEGATWRALCEFLLSTDDPMDFLRCWNEGNFEACRREWPEAPEAVYPTGGPQ
jgi:hypothetical protein